MTWAQSGHFTQRPSGTRLGFSFAGAAIGFRVFLNHAIRDSLTGRRAGGIAEGQRTLEPLAASAPNALRRGGAPCALLSPSLLDALQRLQERDELILLVR